MLDFFKRKKKAYAKTIKLHKKHKTKMIAHRGLSGILLENTVPAFELAGKSTYFGIETDVHITADSKFVVFHDDNTARICNEKYKIEQTDFDTLRSLNLNDLKTGKPNPEFKIPTLDEYISVCKKYDKVCVLELKNPFKKQDVEKLVTAIKTFNYIDKLIFISFNLDNLIFLRELLPNQPLMYLTGDFNDKILEQLKKYRLDLDIEYSALTKSIIDKLHAEGILINAWTCDNLVSAKKLISWGIDYLTTNILE